MEPDDQLDDFCRAHYEALVGALSLHSGRADIAEELAQEAIARLVRDWKKVRDHPAPGAWLFRTAFNLSNSRWRRIAAERRASARSRGDDTAELDLSSAIEVRQVVAALPRRQRTALVCRYFLDLSVRESALLMECSEGTVKALTSQAIKSLRHDDRFAVEEVPDGI